MTTSKPYSWGSCAVALFVAAAGVALGPSCSASGSGNSAAGGAGGSGTGGTGGIGTDSGACGTCTGHDFVPCNPDGTPGTPVVCALACAPDLGCVDCPPGGTGCDGNDIVECTADGKLGGVVSSCDPASGQVCHDGECRNGCEVAEDQASNVGCEFWAVDLDQNDLLNDPANAPWGVVLSNASQLTADVLIEKNDAKPGDPLAVTAVSHVTLTPGTLEKIVLPTRELDCGTKPNDPASPGTCLSSNAFRITASSPIVVYQFNVFENVFSNDASLLLPTNALGKLYRVIGWSAGHPAPIPPFPNDRAYVTVVGTKPNTQVTVRPRWRIKGNPPIAATGAQGKITATLGPFDVLNLETDDATLQESAIAGVSDLSGSTVESTEPVAVFSGVESTSVPYNVDIPSYPGWDPQSTCCLDHLEEQMFPLEAIGKRFVITRSPIRSTGSWHEPDVLRFVGAAEHATVTTTLPPPMDSFEIEPGEIVDTWTDEDVVVTCTAPVIIGQYLISGQRVEGQYTGDPSLTVFAPVEQYRTEYVFLTPPSWDSNHVVIAAVVGTSVTIDGSAPAGCVTAPAGTLDGKAYEARRCPLGEGAHALSGDQPFGIVAYGYGSAGSYAVVGGADVKRIYEPPPLR